MIQSNYSQSINPVDMVAPYSSICHITEL
ncbi:hypothetical protein LOS07_15090 [Proteus mirabilis]|nr:hypothetical protein [Proteus mirabilis]MCD4633448.1 hypothetical protein [Proteus mirabilis]